MVIMIIPRGFFTAYQNKNIKEFCANYKRTKLKLNNLFEFMVSLLSFECISC